ncbi:MAG: hypothetical protein IJO59_03805 [Clostridia bacterium]|nr:hypothetical protein [Clostridia bacterium]
MRPKHARKSRFPWGLLVFLLVVCVLAASVLALFHFDLIDIPEGGFTAATTTTTVATTTTTNTTAATTTTTVATTTTRPTYATAANGNPVFADTLFIGDSRTVGLSLYGKISGADFFADNTMSSFNVLSSKVNMGNLGAVTLKTLLEKKSYSTVYVMFGINEIGSTTDAIVTRYKALLSQIAASQPNATVILQSTFHVREDKQVEKNGLTNKRIDALNTQLATLANGSTVLYRNVTPVFDNENGAMDKQYSPDGIHCYSKHYPLWRDYLMKTAT